MLYYRKFGFEIGCFGKQCQYLLSMIPSFDMKDGYFVLVDESNWKQVLSDVKQLYGAWEVKYNGMIHNEGYEYAFVTESNPYKDQEFTYLYYRGSGKPSAYFTIHKEMRNEGQIVVCTRLVYAGKEGLQDFSTGKNNGKRSCAGNLYDSCMQDDGMSGKGMVYGSFF